MDINKLIKNNVGIDTNKATRKFNGDRYVRLYASLCNAEYKGQAEALRVRTAIDKYRTKITLAKRSGKLDEAKAYSEGLSDVLHKVKNVGVDLWRTIKKLLGQLIIFLEEQIAYLFDKVKLSEKLQDKFALQLAKFAKWGNPRGTAYEFIPNYSGKGDTILPEDIGRLEVDWFHNKALNDAFESAVGKTDIEKLNQILSDAGTGANVWGVDGHNVHNLYTALKENALPSGSSFEKDLNEATKNNSALSYYKVLQYFKMNDSNKERKLRSLAKDYKYAANVFKSFRRAATIDGGSALLNITKEDTPKPADAITTTVNVDASNSSIAKSDENLKGAIGGASSAKITIGKDAVAFKENLESVTNIFDLKGPDGTPTGSESAGPLSTFMLYGAMLEIVVTKIQAGIRLNKLNLRTMVKSLYIEGDNYAKGFAEIYITSRKILLCTVIATQNYKDMRDVYFDFKKRANELKNAPTSITDNYPADVCQGVRALISRSTRAAHWMLKYSSNTLSNYLILLKHASTVLLKIDKLLTEETAIQTDNKMY